MEELIILLIYSKIEVPLIKDESADNKLSYVVFLYLYFTAVWTKA
jgi:hypothetical protein